MNSLTEELNEIHESPKFKPSEPKSRRSYRLEEECYSHDSSHKLYMNDNIYNSRQIQELNLSKKDASLKDDSTNDRQIKESFDEHTKRRDLSFHSQDDIFNKTLKEEFQPESLPKNKQYKNSFYLFIFILIISLVWVWINPFLNLNKKQTQSTNSPVLLFKSIEEIKTKFYNQELDTWIDISSAINEIISKNPKVPQIILLFANETTTMDCLATALAHVSSTALHIDTPLYLNPENFTEDAGEIIDKLNKYSSAKKVVIIRNVLNINAEAIKALHNLCDKINPLIREAIYILTMQTNNYKSSQKKLKFVENQFYDKLSESIDQDILMALVTRITDGAIIPVQPEPHLRYC